MTERTIDMRIVIAAAFTLALVLAALAAFAEDRPAHGEQSIINVGCGGGVMHRVCTADHRDSRSRWLLRYEDGPVVAVRGKTLDIGKDIDRGRRVRIEHQHKGWGRWHTETIGGYVIVEPVCETQ